jgi:hypothetical protein
MLGLPLLLARIAALAAALAAAAGSLLLLALVRRRTPGEAARISARYRHLIVQTDAWSANTYEKVVAVTTFAGLVRLARQHERLILHDVRDGVHGYTVEDGGVAYRYEAQDEELPRVAVPAARRRPVGAFHRARVAALGVLSGFLLVVVTAFTASNVVPASHAGQDTRAITADNLKPTICASIAVAGVRTSGGETNANDLMLGTAGIDDLKGSGGDDCILGGDGVDTLSGQGGGNDICDGGAGVDTGGGCETVYNIP